MSTVAGIFNSRADAERAAEGLRSAGFSEDRLSLLTPGASQDQLDDVPTTETEQPGMGQALGTWAGGALGVAGGLFGSLAALALPGTVLRLLFAVFLAVSGIRLVWSAWHAPARSPGRSGGA
jgi:hypothetical protein